jgi:putative DNA methylase
LISGDHIKAEAQAGRMGEQLYAVVFKKKVITGHTKAGKPKEKWVRGYRAPRPEDDVSQAVAEALAEKLPDWEALDMVPTEAYGDMYADRSKAYGVNYWRDLFSPRQLLGHGTAVEVFRELIDEEKAFGRWNECTAAAFCYLSFSLDKLRDYNSRMSRWHVNREVMVNTFDRHDFAFKWSLCGDAPPN